MAAKRSKLKRRSGTSELPDAPLFLDRAIDSEHIFQALTATGVVITRHRDHFDDDATDPEWLPVVGERGWIVLTKDEAMQYNEIEKLAIKNSGVKLFILVRGDLSRQEMASIFVKALPAIGRISKKNAPPFIAKIYRDGTVLKTNIV